MKGRVWRIVRDPDEWGGKNPPVYAELPERFFTESDVKRIAREIAEQFHHAVAIIPPGKRTAQFTNPGLAPGSQVGYPRWIIFNPDNNEMLAAVVNRFPRSKLMGITRTIANAAGHTVAAVIEYHSGAASNPAEWPPPQGSVWRCPKGHLFTVKGVELSRDEVILYDRDEGKRVWLDGQEFRHTYKRVGRPAANPRHVSHRQALGMARKLVVHERESIRHRENPVEPVAMSQTRGRDWVQEWYDTASGHARIRAAQLRKAGFRVVTETSSQVTPLGRMKMTLVDIRGGDMDNLPPVQIARLPNPKRQKSLVQGRLKSKALYIVALPQGISGFRKASVPGLATGARVRRDHLEPWALPVFIDGATFRMNDGHLPEFQPTGGIKEATAFLAVHPFGEVIITDTGYRRTPNPKGRKASDLSHMQPPGGGPIRYCVSCGQPEWWFGQHHDRRMMHEGRFRERPAGAPNPKRRNAGGGPRIVYNRLLGGWYVVVGPHQTPLNGRFSSKAEAKAWLERRQNPAGEHHRRGPTVGSFWRHLEAPGYVARVAKTERAKGGMPPVVVLEIVVPGEGLLRHIPRVVGTTRLPVNEFYAKHEATRPTGQNPRGAKRPHTVAEGVAIVLEHGGFAGLAADVRAGRADVEAALKMAIAIEQHGRPRVRAILEQALEVVRRFLAQRELKEGWRLPPELGGNPRPNREGNDRDFAAATIRTALKKRSGKPWSVTVGRGTSWGWIDVDAPNRRRTWGWRLKAVGLPDLPENYEEYDTGQPGGHAGPAERAELAALLGLDRLNSYQGVSIPGAFDYYEEYMDRAQGKVPSVIGKPYWDNPRAPFREGERVSVPYMGRTSYFGRRTTRTREKATVQGVDPDGSIHVTIQRGHTTEAHHFRPDQVRRLPGRRVASGLAQLERAKSKTRTAGVRALRHEAEAAVSAAEREAECETALAQLAVPAFGEKPTPEYVRHRARMRRAQLTAAANRELAAEYERADPEFADPWAEPAAAVASNPRRRSRANPRPIERAARTFEMWHEFRPRHVSRMTGPPRRIPRTLVRLGEVTRIDYKSRKFTGRMAEYTHKTEHPRPVLATDPDARHVYLVGGNMKVTADGLKG
jgi:hypothetical protein